MNSGNVPVPIMSPAQEMLLPPEPLQSIASISPCVSASDFLVDPIYVLPRQIDQQRQTISDANQNSMSEMEQIALDNINNNNYNAGQLAGSLDQNFNTQANILQMVRRPNSNIQSNVGQSGYANSNIQNDVDQARAQAQNFYRRQNSNHQSGIQQNGWGNANSQSDIGQINRRRNSNEQRQVQQSGWGNSNVQGGIRQAGHFIL